MTRYPLTATVILTFVAAAGNAAAQADWSPPAKASLAISLNGLKESAAQMKRRNAWLHSEVQVLEMKIEQAGRPDRSSALRPQAAGTYQPVAAAANPLTVSAPAVPGPEAIGMAKEDRLLKEIAAVEQDIREMTAALEAMPGAKDALPPADEPYAARVRSAEDNIKLLRRQLQDVDSRHAGALADYNRLQKKNLELEESRAELLAQLQNNEAEHGRLNDELKTLDERMADDISSEQKRVAELQAQQQRLESVLRKVDLRTEGKPDRLQISDQEIETLMENRHFIQTENTSLKDQFTRLQEDWKEITKSPKK